MEIVILVITVCVSYEVYNKVVWNNCQRRVSAFSEKTSSDFLAIFDSSFRIIKVEKYNSHLTICSQKGINSLSLWDVFSPAVVMNMFKGYQSSISRKSPASIRFVSHKGNSVSCITARFIPLKNGHVACLLHEKPVLKHTEIISSPRYEMMEMLNADLLQQF